MHNCLSFAPRFDSSIIDVDFNDITLGELYQECNGYYVFESAKGKEGYWTAWILHEIADHLDFLNCEWDRQILQYLDYQETLGCEFEEILQSNLWDLYEK